MIWVFVVLGAVLVVAIAIVAVAIAVGRLEHESRPALYELEEAVDYIAENLPHEVTSRITYDDVRQVLRWHLDWFEAVGLATEYGEELGDQAVPEGDLVVADDDAAIDFVVERTLASGGPDPVDVVCILDVQMRYLDEIGAVGRRADEDRGHP